MAQIQKTDTQLKNFFENSLGMVIRKATFNRGTLTYYMYAKPQGQDVLFEQRPDTSMSVTIGGVTRNIPARDKIQTALGHQPSELEICRIVQEVILKMFDDQLDETKRQVGRDFDRFSRRGR